MKNVGKAIFCFLLVLVVTGCGGGGNDLFPQLNFTVCGNDTVQTGEQCDDGNTTTETCDYGQTSCIVCDSSCQSVAGATSYCGDETLDSANNEQCDDGNTTNNDGCSSLCKIDFSKTFGGTSFDQPASIQQTTDGGYIVAGFTGSYGAGSSDFWVIKLDSSGEKQWDNTFGGTSGDAARSIHQTTDGGYIVAGLTDSYGAGDYDFWVIKLDSSGEKQWDNTFGGTSYDEARSIRQTTDGGYIVVGDTHSYGAGGRDFWVIKLDSSGEKQWDNTFGGTSWDRATSIQQTTDGGYIVAGRTESYGAGDYDLWVIKIDSSGEKQWDNTFGGTSFDGAYSIQQTTDGGYIVAGRTESYGAGFSDFWVIKLDSSGEKQWDNTFGGISFDGASSIQQTTDGGYIVAGITDSYGAGFSDFWVIKLDSSGGKQWDNTFGGTSIDHAQSIQQTTDGGYIVAGGTESYGAGDEDFWVLKLDSEGNCNGCFEQGIEYNFLSN